MVSLGKKKFYVYFAIIINKNKIQTPENTLRMAVGKHQISPSHQNWRDQNPRKKEICSDESHTLNLNIWGIFKFHRLSRK